MIKKILMASLIAFAITQSSFADSGEADYSSFLVNQSNQSSKSWVLVKTRTWPESGCIIASGLSVIQPGEKSELVIAKKKKCD